MKLDQIILWLAKSGGFGKVVACPGTSTFVVPDDCFGYYRFVDLTEEGDNYTCHTVEIVLPRPELTTHVDISDYELVFWATDGIVTHYTFDSPGANPFHWCDHLPESSNDFYLIIEKFQTESIKEVYRYA